MTDTRDFHIGTVLSALTGRLLSPHGMGGVYDICEFVSGEQGLMTHQLPRVLDEMKPYLREQFPKLATVEIPADGMDTYDRIFTWFDLNLYDEFGEMLTVRPMPKEAHTRIDPIDELIMKMPQKPVIVVTTPETLDHDE